MNLQGTNEFCPLCNREVSERLSEHFQKNHFISLQTFLEMNIPEKPLLTYLDPEQFNYPLPDWGTKNFEYEQAKNSIRAAQHDFYSHLLGDRYLQMYICDDIFPEITMTHKFSDYSKVLRELKPLDRNKLWLIDFIPGFPKNICIENVKGLKIVDIDDYFKTSSSEEKITLGDYTLELPYDIPYDHRHHSQFNILNKKTEMKNKRLRIGKDKCIKIVSGKLFRLSGPENISKANLTVLKLLLMRNKVFMRMLINIMEEITKSIGILRDGIFMRNTVVFDKKNPIEVSIGWTEEDNNNINDNYIKLSVL